MKSNRSKKNFGALSFLILINLILIVQAFALDFKTHEAINSHIADENSAIYGNYLHGYLRSNLGMQNGVKTELNSKMAKEWLFEGGKCEDKPSWCVPYWRSRNHFHNPINNSGFSGWWDTGIFAGMSAIDWAMKPVHSQSCGYYSWNDARDYYYKALTSTDKATREMNFADTFRAIGQVMHLVQDMSVPEHTCNNGHYFFYDYEEWAKENLNISDYYDPAMTFTPSAAYSLSINNLFDTHQYGGTNPGITSQSTIGLAEYSNANFLSQDTIFTDFVYPSYSDTAIRIEPDPVTQKDVLYLDKIGNGDNIHYLARALEFHNYLPTDYKKLALTLDDEKVYKSYASFLIPRAIGYSSQVLSYFFRGQLDVEMGAGSVKVKNGSTETMEGGAFGLYYDDANGVRSLVTSANVSTLAPGSEQTISFSPPTGAVSYMLVYNGKLGDEMNAVAGKYISGYWEPWDGPLVNSKNDWQETFYGTNPFSIDGNGVLHFDLVSPATGTFTGLWMQTSIPIPHSELYFNISSTLTLPAAGAVHFYSGMYMRLVDDHGNNKTLILCWSAPWDPYPWVVIGDNDGKTPISLSPLTGHITFLEISANLDSGVSGQFQSDFMDFR
jgi:hypothetical protein